MRTPLELLAHLLGRRKSKNGRELLRKKMVLRLNVLGRHHRSRISKEKLYGLLTEFFKEYFHIHYEFTYAELELELQHRRINEGLRLRIASLCDALSESQFGDQQQPMNELIDEAKAIINEL